MPTRIGKLYAYVLLDGASFELYEPLRRMKTTLGVLTGTRIRIRLVGDTAQSDAIYLNSLSTRQKKELLDRADRYVEDKVQRGREQDHILEETRRLAAALNVAEDGLPALVFVVPGSREVIARLRFEPGWYRSEEHRRQLLAVIVRWFESRRLLEVLEKRLTPNEIRSWLQRELEALEMSVNQAIGEALLEADELRRRARSTAPQVPAGTRLVFERSSRVVRFDGVELRLRPVAHAFLLRLGETPGIWVNHDALVEAARSQRDDAQPTVAKLVKDYKLLAMKALREAAGRIGAPKTEINRLIESKPGYYRLALTEAQVLIR